MMIFIYFIIKQYGVHLTIFLMIEDTVCMHIIGKIIEENPMGTIMIPNHVYVGNQMIL